MVSVELSHLLGLVQQKGGVGKTAHRWSYFRLMQYLQVSWQLKEGPGMTMAYTIQEMLGLNLTPFHPFPKS